MVARPSVSLERQDHRDGKTVDSGGVGRLDLWMGSDLRRGSHGRPMVPGGEAVAHQLPRGSSGLPRREMLCQRQERRFSAAEVGQYLSSVLHEQVRRHSLAETECHCERTVALVHGERHHPDCGAPTKRPEHDSGRGVQRDEGQDRLGAESTED